MHLVALIALLYAIPHLFLAAECLARVRLKFIFCLTDIDFIDEVANICHSLSWAPDVPDPQSRKV